MLQSTNINRGSCTLHNRVNGTQKLNKTSYNQVDPWRKTSNNNTKFFKLYSTNGSINIIPCKYAQRHKYIRQKMKEDEYYKPCQAFNHGASPIEPEI